MTSIELPDELLSVGDSIFYGCVKLGKIKIKDNLSALTNNLFAQCLTLSCIECESLVAPAATASTFGAGASTYTGRNSYSAGTNVLRVPYGATGYDQGAWLSVLCNATKCGFHIEYTNNRDEVGLDDGSTLYAEGKISAIAIE